jgi:hypothetical protein
VAEGAGLYLDYSKNRLTASTIAGALADECDLRDRIPNRLDPAPRSRDRRTLLMSAGRPG